jgi:hypothetical protein
VEVGPNAPVFPLSASSGVASFAYSIFTHLPKNFVRSHPAVDAATVVPNLKARALNRLDQVQILAAADATQHDIPSAKRAVIGYRNDRAQLP